MEENSQDTLQAIRQWTLALPLVSAYLGGVVSSKSDRDDLLQETAVAVLKSYATFDSSRPFSSWVLGIAQNIVRNHFRRLSRERLVFDDSLLASLAESFEVVAPGQSAMLDRLDECLERLAPESRRVCELRYREDLPLEAISERLGKSTSAIAKALQRIREQLRQCIGSKMISSEPT